MSVSEVVVIQLLSRQSTGVNQNCITCFVTGSRLGDDGLCVDAAWGKKRSIHCKCYTFISCPLIDETIYRGRRNNVL